MASRGVLLLWSACCVAVLLCALLAIDTSQVMPVLCRCNWERNVGINQREDIKARRDRIKSVCAKHHSSQALQQQNHGWGIHRPSMRPRDADCNAKDCPLFVDQSRSLAVCFIAKVASTSVKSFFVPLLNITVADNKSDVMHRSFNSQTLRFGAKALLHSSYSNYTKVLFVRHPFERLVSTYIDKALRRRTEGEWAYRSYWNKIPGVKAENRSPTFPEFVDFLLTTPVESWDAHWYPYYTRCQPCLLDYDFVGKLETASRDFPAFLSLVGLEEKKALLAHYNDRRNVSGQWETNSEHYFAQLSFDQVMELYTRYFYDFELFGYDFRDYLP